MRIIKPLHQGHTGTLATAAATDEGEGLSGLHRERQTSEDRHIWPGRVTEPYLLEGNFRYVVLLRWGVESKKMIRNAHVSNKELYIQYLMLHQFKRVKLQYMAISSGVTVKVHSTEKTQHHSSSS